MMKRRDFLEHGTVAAAGLAIVSAGKLAVSLKASEGSPQELAANPDQSS
jgi:hypothetical protein